jgi:membrane protein YqaA with SNARE-associated domain
VGLDEILERYPKLSRKRLERAAELFDRHGTIIPLLTCIPGLDTVVALAAGAFDVKKGTFIIWVAIAKTVRFWLLAVIITGVLSLLG